MRIPFFLFFFPFLLKKFAWLLPLPTPSPFPTGKDFFPHCGLESKKGGFIFSGDL